MKWDTQLMGHANAGKLHTAHKQGIITTSWLVLLSDGR